MSKRSKGFQRLKGDRYYTTDPRVMHETFLFDFSPGETFYEPCAGGGDLIRLLESQCLYARVDGELVPDKPLLRCVGSSDAELDATVTQYDTDADYFITNPPWSRDLLHGIIHNLRFQRPTWLLFDADWMHTGQSREYLSYCTDIISVGRVCWFPKVMPDGTLKRTTGFDNCAWYKFVDYGNCETRFWGP